MMLVFTLQDRQLADTRLQFYRLHLRSCQVAAIKIHLLLTDVVMPLMNGFELAARLAELHPETRVLHMSAYSANALARSGIVSLT